MWGIGVGHRSMFERQKARRCFAKSRDGCFPACVQYPVNVARRRDRMEDERWGQDIPAEALYNDTRYASIKANQVVCSCVSKTVES